MNLEHFSISKNSRFLNCLIFILLIFSLKAPLESCAQAISPDVVNIRSFEYRDGKDVYSFSIGEPFILTLESDYILTQGFLQPEIRTPCTEFILIAFPNPTAGNLNFRFEGCDDKVRKVMVLDVFGKILYNAFISENKLDLSSLSTGIYLLKAFNATGKELGVAKIAKVDKL